jgi:hypothetical protein
MFGKEEGWAIVVHGGAKGVAYGECEVWLSKEEE